MARATFYVVFDAEVSGGRTVRQVKARRITLTPPALNGGEVCSRFEVEIPDSAFIRLVPTVDVVIPEGWWSSQPVQVVVPAPEGDA